MTSSYAPSSIDYNARSTGRGFWRRLLDGMIAARKREVEREVAQTLATFSDDNLRNLGFTREELARWHSGAAE